MGNALQTVSNTLPETLEADAQAARDFARESLSPATRRAYRSDIRAFETWCAERGVESIPAAPEAVASFLAHEAQRGLAVSSISRRAAAIRLFHRAAGHVSKRGRTRRFATWEQTLSKVLQDSPVLVSAGSRP